MYKTIKNNFRLCVFQNGAIDISLQELTLKKDDLTNKEMQPGKYAMLSVSDNGSGIPKKDQEKIFDPFFTRKERGKGTGLGLSVVYGIVKDQNGDIRVYSKVGEGTRFVIFLPQIEHATKNRDTVVSETNGSGNERILIVDDEAFVVETQKQILERYGYTVSKFTNSLEALKAFKAHPQNYDLVITDLPLNKENSVVP